MDNQLFAISNAPNDTDVLFSFFNLRGFFAVSLSKFGDFAGSGLNLQVSRIVVGAKVGEDKCAFALLLSRQEVTLDYPARLPQSPLSMLATHPFRPSGTSPLSKEGISPTPTLSGRDLTTPSTSPVSFIPRGNSEVIG